MGRHAVGFFRRRRDDVRGLRRADDAATWRRAFEDVDGVLHLAAAIHPEDQGEFLRVNLGVTQQVTSCLDAAARQPKVLVSSTIHAAGPTGYGVSKRLAEEWLAKWAIRAGGEAVIFRLPHLFGRGSKPQYNSVVATWCYRIARGLPYEVADPSRQLHLLFIDDAIAAFARELDAPFHAGATRFAEAGPLHEISLGALRDVLESFRASWQTQAPPNLRDPLVAQLYSTYESYVPS